MALPNLGTHPDGAVDMPATGLWREIISNVRDRLLFWSNDDVAVVDLAGNRISANVSLLEEPALGDYVLVHAGFAITKLSPEDARETLDVFQQLEESLGDRDLPEAAPDDR